jgi:hypothetical protein
MPSTTGDDLSRGAERKWRRPGANSPFDAARQPTWRIWAQNSPFAVKDQLKSRSLVDAGLDDIGKNDRAALISMAGRAGQSRLMPRPGRLGAS